MHTRTRWAALGCAALLGAGLLSAATPAVATEDPAVEEIASGLNNPRQLALRPDGTILVAEAGRGGDACDEHGCVGPTGSVAALDGGAPAANRGVTVGFTRIITGLTSAADDQGLFAVGTNGVAVQGNNRTYPLQTFAPPDLLPDGAPPGDDLGKLLLYGPSGRQQQIADISGYEIANDSDGDGVDSNPYSAAFLRGEVFVADAAGDAILAVPVVGRDRTPRLVTTFDRRVVTFSTPGGDVTAPRDPVPTSVVVGPDAMIYVGELGPGRTRARPGSGGSTRGPGTRPSSPTTSPRSPGSPSGLTAACT